MSHDEELVVFYNQRRLIKGLEAEKYKIRYVLDPCSGGNGGPRTGGRQYTKLLHWCEPEVMVIAEIGQW